ncbi:MAG: RNA-binding S4 domain-containing protein [Rhodospirillaceae bacterium]|nr:RNA-binding S4 domain-containing protein [Rhodospirillaceae bacterium]
MSETQRLDKWLWQTRFYKTRGLAQRMCGAGKVRINSRRVRKAHYALKAGDILTCPQGSRIRVVRILAMPKRRGPAVEAQLCYEDVEGEEAPGMDANLSLRDAGEGLESKT